MFGHSLQKETELLLSRCGVAAKDFKSFRNPIINGDYQVNELILGVTWAAVQQLCWYRRGGFGDIEGLGDALTTVLGQRVIAEHHSQKLSHNIHGGIA